MLFPSLSYSTHIEFRRGTAPDGEAERFEFPNDTQHAQRPARQYEAAEEPPGSIAAVSIWHEPRRQSGVR